MIQLRWDALHLGLPHDSGIVFENLVVQNWRMPMGSNWRKSMGRIAELRFISNAAPLLMSNQWKFQDPKMEVLYHIRPCFEGMSP